MSCTQNLLCPSMRLGTPATKLSRTHSLSRVSFVPVSALCTSNQIFQQQKISRLAYRSPMNKTCAPICFFGGNQNSRGGNKTFSWDSLKDAFEGWRQKDIVQDNLRGQMRQQKFGGGDENPPGGGGGGGGSDGTEDEGFSGILDEALQVFLATIGFIFVYIYIIRGAELLKLGRDYVKYLLGGVPSARLQRVMDKWRKTMSRFSYDEDWEECDDWLERLIVTTPTWWHRPEEFARVAESRRRRDRQQN